MDLVLSGYGPFALLMGYLFGSIPFGLLLTRAAGLGDVRKIGSGNIGATNVLRTGHKGLAAATLLLDLLKGTVAVLIVAALAHRVTADTAARLVHIELALAGLAYLAGLGAFLGHLFPVWLNFAGGKGVATYLGVLLALHTPAAIVFCLGWAAVAATTRYSSLAALAGSALVLLYYLLLGQAGGVFIMIMTLLLFARHRENIRRLLDGTEPRIGSAG
jgi:glycerol-3-phosphate acyltransferase PlsY